MNQNVNRKIGNEEVAVMLLERMKREIEKTKERVVFRLVDREVFGGRLDELVSVDAGNGFSLIFTVCFGDCYMYINKELASSLDLDEEEIYELSMVNTPRMYPATFQDRATLMVKMFNDFDEVLLGEAASSAEEFLKELEVPLLDELDEADRQLAPYVLSCKGARYGASCIFYPGAAKKIAELLDSEYYVIPCSRHEVIIEPCNSSMQVDEIKKMVKEINRTCIASDDLLSDNVLKYDSKLDALVKA